MFRLWLFVIVLFSALSANAATVFWNASDGQYAWISHGVNLAQARSRGEAEGEGYIEWHSCPGPGYYATIRSHTDIKRTNYERYYAAGVACGAATQKGALDVAKAGCEAANQRNGLGAQCKNGAGSSGCDTGDPSPADKFFRGTHYMQCTEQTCYPSEAKCATSHPVSSSEPTNTLSPSGSSPSSRNVSPTPRPQNGSGSAAALQRQKQSIRQSLVDYSVLDYGSKVTDVSIDWPVECIVVSQYQFPIVYDLTGESGVLDGKIRLDFRKSIQISIDSDDHLQLTGAGVASYASYNPYGDTNWQENAIFAVGYERSNSNQMQRLVESLGEMADLCGS